MSSGTATSLVQNALDTINAHKWRDLLIPHGFKIERLVEESRSSDFEAPGRFGRRVTATLAVPVLYSPDSRSWRLRAALPADRDNFARLREWIEHEVRRAPFGRLRLSDWQVSPDETPAPYLPSGAPNGPPADWTVVAVFEADGLVVWPAAPVVAELRSLPAGVPA